MNFRAILFIYLFFFPLEYQAIIIFPYRHYINYLLFYSTKPGNIFWVLTPGLQDVSYFWLYHLWRKVNLLHYMERSIKKKRHLNCNSHQKNEIPLLSILFFFVENNFKSELYFFIWFALVRNTIAMWSGRLIQFLRQDDNRSWKSNFTHTQESTVSPRSDTVLV